mmetsp:Transcript_36535/g.49411  ORF Transcript_36535/g.49411 Transcript_36535/m.49411 type:complete len:81 (+) Transcript_36535:812-1054(+)
MIHCDQVPPVFIKRKRTHTVVNLQVDRAEDVAVAQHDVMKSKRMPPTIGSQSINIGMDRGPRRRDLARIEDADREMVRFR